MDIVERLRNRFHGIEQLRDPAADTIEALRNQVAELTKELDHFESVHEKAVRRHVNAEAHIVELREFVQLLADYIPASAIGNMTVQQALATTDDSSALDRRLQEERERCIEACVCSDCSAEIRRMK